MTWHGFGRLLLTGALAALAPPAAAQQPGEVEQQEAVTQRADGAESGVEPLSRCERRAERNLGRLDRVGDAASSVTRRIGRFVGASERSVERVLNIGRSLSAAIASRLDCDEQAQAEAATEEAVEGGVGTTISWASETREGVTGFSTVTAAESNAPDGDCLTVTDIVIVEGEETRAPKRMCRRPPSNRYVRV